MCLCVVALSGQTAITTYSVSESKWPLIRPLTKRTHTLDPSRLSLDSNAILDLFLYVEFLEIEFPTKQHLPGYASR